MKTKQKYYLYIDDSGSRFPDHHNTECRLDGMDHFALGGVLIKDEDRENVASLYTEFCRNWSINYPLHSTKIRGMRSDFAWLEESTKQRDVFLSELEEFLVSLPVLGFAVVIHRPGYNLRYRERYHGKPWWMCKTAYSILIERVVKYVADQEGVLIVRFEEAGKKEDRSIIQYARDLKSAGMPFATESSKAYGGLQTEDFTNHVLGEPRRKKKRNLYVQLADLYLYPMAKSKYESTYSPWVELCRNQKVIDALLGADKLPTRGIKYSCFDEWDSKKPRNP